MAPLVHVQPPLVTAQKHHLSHVPGALQNHHRVLPPLRGRHCPPPRPPKSPGGADRRGVHVSAEPAARLAATSASVTAERSCVALIAYAAVATGVGDCASLGAVGVDDDAEQPATSSNAHAADAVAAAALGSAAPESFAMRRLSRIGRGLPLIGEEVYLVLRLFLLPVVRCCAPCSPIISTLISLLLCVIFL